MERLGLGPEAMHARNPRLVYGRMTGWGQTGPLAERAGHDINYIALAGVLNAIGRAGEAPVPPLNLVGDFGGGGMLLAFGIACGADRGARSGPRPGRRRGDGRRRVAAGDDVLRAASPSGQWRDGSAAPTSSTPARRGTTPTRRATAGTCRDRRDRAEVLRRAARAARPRRLARRDAARPRDAGRRCASASPQTFAQRTRAEWERGLRRLRCLLRAGARRSPNRAAHPHVAARAGTIEVGGIAQPAPAPRFDRTPSAAPSPPPERGSGGAEALAATGASTRAAIDALRGLGVGCALAAQRRAAPQGGRATIAQSAARASAHSPARFGGATFVAQLQQVRGQRAHRHRDAGAAARRRRPRAQQRRRPTPGRSRRARRRPWPRASADARRSPRSPRAARP